MSDAVDFSGRPQRYKFSGKLGRSLVLLPMLSIMLVVVAALIYGLISMSLPYMKLKIAISIVTGMGLGYAAAWLAQRLRCRSPLYLAFVGLLAACAGVQIIMASIVNSIVGPSSPGLVSLIFDPGATWNYLTQIAQSGIYTKRSRVMSATDVWVDWGFEMVPFFFSIPVTAWVVFKKQIFCEPCLKWLDVKSQSVQFEKLTDDNDILRAKQGDLAAVAEKPILRVPYAEYLRLDYVVCSDCGNTGTYRFVDVKGPEEEKNLSGLMLLTEENVPVLGAILAKKENPAPAADKLASGSVEAKE